MPPGPASPFGGNDTKAKEVEHGFSVELSSQAHLKRVSLSDDGEAPVLIEGFLGESVRLSHEEDSVLVIAGTNGTLRLDLSAIEIACLLKKTGSVN